MPFSAHLATKASPTHLLLAVTFDLVVDNIIFVLETKAAICSMKPPSCCMAHLAG